MEVMVTDVPEVYARLGATVVVMLAFASGDMVTSEDVCVTYRSDAPVAPSMPVRFTA